MSLEDEYRRAQSLMRSGQEHYDNETWDHILLSDQEDVVWSLTLSTIDADLLKDLRQQIKLELVTRTDAWRLLVGEVGETLEINSLALIHAEIRRHPGERGFLTSIANNAVKSSATLNKISQASEDILEEAEVKQLSAHMNRIIAQASKQVDRLQSATAKTAATLLALESLQRKVQSEEPEDQVAAENSPEQ